MKKDNRIPSVISDFANRSTTKNEMAFLSFEDWIVKKEHESKDWIVVARSWNDETTDLFTFSALVSKQKGSLKELLSNSNWDVQTTFGNPYFYSQGADKTVHYDSGEVEKSNNLEFHPFTIRREFHGYVPSVFEIIQNFVLYHEAFFVSELNEYHKINDDGEIQPIIRISKERENLLVLIDVHSLRDYLTAIQCYLVRYHDHKRWSTTDMKQVIKGKFASYKRHGKSYNFELWLRTDIPWKEYKTNSRLLGKDVIFPYPELDESHTCFITGKRKKTFADFVIGRDERGKEILSTCDEEKLSNYFVDRGTPHFLTPVFFQREVLVKYYQEPTRYRVSGHGVALLDLWSIPIDITDERLVQVWLGDLGRIPYKEQLHWRSFNVAPKGTIAEHRWRTDFLAEFAETTDVIHSFRTAFEEVQQISKSRYGSELFLGLDDKDAQIYATLHIPLTDEWKEFDEQIQGLAKLIIDSLNVNLLSRESGKKIDKKQVKGSIDLLKEYLIKIGVEEKVKSKILNALFIVQTLRSTGVAHRAGSNFYNALKRFQLDNLSNYERVKKVVANLIIALSLISDAISKQ